MKSFILLDLRLVFCARTSRGAPEQQKPQAQKKSWVPFWKGELIKQGNLKKQCKEE
jgi:hypothetical protein